MAKKHFKFESNVVGYISGKVEIKTAATGARYICFSLGIDRDDKSKNTDYITIKIWESSRLPLERIVEHFKNGDMVEITGKQKAWIETVDLADGSKRKIKNWYIECIEIAQPKPAA